MSRMIGDVVATVDQVGDELERLDATGTAPDEYYGRQPATPPLGFSELVDCPRCHGSGEVHSNPSPINDPQCVVDHVCPACHGDAMVTSDRICTGCLGAGHDCGRRCETCDGQGTL